MTPDDLDRLEALAAAARETSHDGWLNAPFLMAFIDDDDATVMDPADAAYIAALDPTTVRELIAAARETEALRLALEHLAEPLRQRLEDVAASDSLGRAWQAAETALRGRGS